MRSIGARIVLVLSIYVLRSYYAIADGQKASAKVLRNENDPGSGSKVGRKAKSLVTRPKERFTVQNDLPRKSVTNKLESRRVIRRYNKSSSNNKTLNSPRFASTRFKEESEGDDSESRSHAEETDIDVTYLGDRTTLSESKAYAITRQVSAFISLVASIALLIMLLRSYTGLGTTFHRLLFGLCIADILSSFASVFATAMAPKETSYYIWNARGNSATCDAQGFILAFGSAAGILYNCSLCFYHLSVVRYERSDEYIRKKIEPYYHAVSILIPLVVSFTTLAKQAFNPAPNTGICWGFQYNPPHCENLDLNTGEVPDDDMYTIECGRGPDATLLSLIFGLPMLLSSPIVIVVTMTMTYRAVLKNEKKLSKYGVGALRASVAKSSMMATSNANGIGRRSSVFSTFQNFRRGSWDPNSSSMSGSHDQIQFQVQMQRNELKRRKKRTARSRAVLKKGISYSSAYLLCYMPYLVSYAVYVAIDRKTPFFLILFIQMFIPLQGFFNVIIFISPKIRAVRVNNDISFFRAVLKAVKSRGQKKHRNSLHDYAWHRRESSFIETAKNSLRSSLRRWKKQDESRCAESEPNRLSQSIHRLSSNFALNLGNVDVKVKLGVEVVALSDNYQDSVSNRFKASDSLEPYNPQDSEAEDDYKNNISHSLSENKDSSAHNAQDINNLHQTKDGSNPQKESMKSEVENLVEDDDDDVIRNTNSASSLQSNPMNRQCGKNDFSTRCDEGKKVPTKDKQISARKVEEGTLSRIYNELALRSNTHVSLDIDIPEQRCSN